MKYKYKTSIKALAETKHCSSFCSVHCVKLHLEIVEFDVFATSGCN